MKKQYHSLTELFLDVLHSYENSESTCIVEFSNDTDKSFKELEEELDFYKEEFDRLYEEEIKGGLKK